MILLDAIVFHDLNQKTRFVTSGLCTRTIHEDANVIDGHQIPDLSFVVRLLVDAVFFRIIQNNLFVILKVCIFDYWRLVSKRLVARKITVKFDLGLPVCVMSRGFRRNFSEISL